MACHWPYNKQKDNEVLAVRQRNTGNTQQHTLGHVQGHQNT